MAEQAAFSGWAVLELMGHRRLAGYVQAQEIAGAGMLRLDVPAKDGTMAATQFYSPAALYCLTPTTEEIATAVALSNQPAPVARWELPQLEAARGQGESTEVCVCGERLNVGEYRIWSRTGRRGRGTDDDSRRDGREAPPLGRRRL